MTGVGAIHHEQVVDLPGLTPLVRHRVLRIGTHAGRADFVNDLATLLDGVFRRAICIDHGTAHRLDDGR